MTGGDLLVLVPTRGRPGNAHRLNAAFRQTCLADTRLAFLVDDDDPHRNEYESVGALTDACFVVPAGPWRPMVPKLNGAAVGFADGDYQALAFMGDDHLPVTPGWDATFLAELEQLGTGIVYGNDEIQRERLCTAWAMTVDIVRALGAMVPAPVEHMYCDNAVMTLGQEAACIRYLSDVTIEHLHPLAGKASWDPGYERVNSAAQYDADRKIYKHWLGGKMHADAATVRALKGADNG